MHIVAMQLIEQERELQKKALSALTLPYDVADPSVSSFAKLAVLVEEVGEVAKTVVDYNDGAMPSSDVGKRRILEELTQVAAVAEAWMEAILEEIDE